MQESAAASLELLGPILGDQRRVEPRPPSGPPPQFSKPRPPLEPPPMSRPPGLIEFRPPNSNTPLLCTVIANTKTEKKKSKKVSTTASKTASKDKGAVMVSIEKPLTPENHNKLKQSTPSAAETEEANLNAELEKIRWKRELARLKRENESLKQRISQKEEIELEEDVVNIPPRPPAGPPPQLVTSNGTDNSSNELSGTASSIWSMLKSAVDATLGLSTRTTPLPLSGTSMVITEPTEPLPPQMIQTRRKEAIVGGALSRSSNGTNGVPLSEVPLTPIPMLLNGRNTVWRMPFNGKG